MANFMQGSYDNRRAGRERARRSSGVKESIECDRNRGVLIQALNRFLLDAQVSATHNSEDTSRGLCGIGLMLDQPLAPLHRAVCWAALQGHP
jgi:hypothetical protein